MSGVLVLLTGAGLTVAAIVWLPVPFVWVAALWCVIAGAGTALVRIPRWRALWINLGAVALTLGLAEGYFWYTSAASVPERFEGSYTTDYFRADELLGYAPAKDFQARVIKHVGDERVYDKVYTINAHGLRIAPPHESEGSAVLFFGGSVTFGEGVDDDQTMPYQVGLKTQGRFAIYNFGFHGYGPHQMLSALQQGWVEEIVEQMPLLVIYQAIPAHVARAVGLASWDLHGPRYLLDGEGKIYRAGHFDDVNDGAGAASWSWLERSLVYQRLFGQMRGMRDREVRLYLAIVEAARDTVRQQFPGCAFHVLLWGDRTDQEGGMFQDILHGLTAADIPVSLISDILPDYADNRSRYELSSHDRHPTAEAHELIADYVIKHILAEIRFDSPDGHMATGSP